MTWLYGFLELWKMEKGISQQSQTLILQKKSCKTDNALGRAPDDVNILSFYRETAEEKTFGLET